VTPIKKSPVRAARKQQSLGSLFVRFILPVIAIVLLLFAVKHVADTRKVDVAVAPPIQPATAPFVSTVAGNGVIEAQTENIAVGSPTPGLVVEVFVKEGDKVQPGTPLLRLDDRQLRSELGVRQANVAAAKADLQRLENQPRPEEIPVQEAMVNEAQANLTQMADTVRRTKDLFTKRVSTDQELTQAQQNYRAAEAKLAHEQAQLKLLKAGAWQYEKDVVKAAIEQAISQLEQTKIELDRLVVRALVDGQVLQVNVRPGEFVGAPHIEPLMIIGDVRNMHVRVDIDENDIPRFSPGQNAVAMIKGNPKIRFTLKYVKTEPYVVPKKSLTGANTERVDTRVLQVIYAFDPTDKPVFVGQQVEVFIDAAASPSSSATTHALPATSNEPSVAMAP
jgi:multidrug resistance efflux pump